MTATISQARYALKAALQMDGVQVSAFPPGTVNPPALVISQDEGDFLREVTMDGQHDLDLIITAFVERGQDRSSNDLLDEFAADTGPKSVEAAIEADPTLGGVVTDSAVGAAQNFGSFSYAGGEYLGCTFAVEILL